MRTRLMLIAGSWFWVAHLALALEVEIRNDTEFVAIGDVKLALDAYVPKHGRGPFPCIVWVHGGGFVSGDKKDFPRQLLDPICDAGCAMIALNYRLAPQYPFPARVGGGESVVAAVCSFRRWGGARNAKTRWTAALHFAGIESLSRGFRGIRVSRASPPS